MFGLFIKVWLSSTLVTAGVVYGLDLGNWSYAVTTNSTDAQKWFDLGWLNMWGFNHEEAIRCYDRALMLDPGMVMAQVGISLCYGPDFNNEIGLSSDLARDHAQHALMLIENSSSPVNYTDEEKAIVAAVVSRVKQNATATMFDCQAYTDSMRTVYSEFNSSLPVISLLAEALILSRKQSALWVKDGQGQLVPSSSEIADAKSVLEQGFQIRADYPALCHLYIHVMEQSGQPGKALVHADHLRNTVPDQGHLRHMPSHIDVWVGHFQDSVDANLIAIASDNKYLAMNGNRTQEYYKTYVLHNHHFLVWSCMFTAQSEVAMRYARNLQALISDPNESYTVIGGNRLTTKDFEMMGFAPWQAMLRFAKWDLILAEPLPAQKDVYPTVIATAYLTRAIAYAFTNRVNEALAERVKFEAAVQNPALKDQMLQQNVVWNPNSTVGMAAMSMMVNSADEIGVLNVGYYVLNGLIAYAQNNVTASVTCLQHAVEIEDNLHYAEPWGWMVPSRHFLGAILLAQRIFNQAEVVFRADLEMYPNNLWALNGLYQSLTGQKMTTQAADVMTNYTTAASRADVNVNATLSLIQNPILVANGSPGIMFSSLPLLGLWLLL